jgi:hypothetical protein
MGTQPQIAQAVPLDMEQEQATVQQPQADSSNIPEELQIALWSLLTDDLERQDEVPRRYEIREILKRRLFFRGEQYWWWDNDAGIWNPPNVLPIGVGLNDYERPAFQHVTNIFQAYCLSLCSVLSQNNVASKFWPRKASDPGAVQTAKNASKVVDFIHRNNDVSNLNDQATYYMCTDGFMGSYTRYVSDGERFGNDPLDVIALQDVPVGNPQVTCPSCGYSAEGTTEMQPTCPDCGEPLQDQPPATTQVPYVAGTVNVPRGQEVITVVPALQLKRTMWADDQKDFLYLDWITDLHKSKAMATYPDKAEKIDSGAGDTDGGTASTYERIARRLLYLGTGRHTGMVLKDLGTFRRAWIRPTAFYGIAGHSDTEQVPCKRCQLLKIFPQGAAVVFFNDVFCEAKNESMDERWETMHTMPGEGQLRETLVSAIVPVCEQLNDCINLLFEICMYGVPEGFAAQKLIDFEARSKQDATAGNITPTVLDDNQDIRSKLLFTPAVEPSMAMMKYIDMLLNIIPQFLTGAFPALFGGDTGSNDTASGIQIQRNQSLGRIGRAWRRLQIFWANTDGKAVTCFAKNRTEDLEVPRESQSGGFESDTIRLTDMQGEVTAYPEVDAQYPTLQSDIRALYLSFMNSANPLFMAVAQDPVNMETVFRGIGLSDLQVPGEEQRVKTFKDIEQMQNEQPQQGQPIPAQNGMPEQPGPMIPSVEPDPDVDNLKVAGDTAKTWLVSEAGQDAKINNPAWYMNVKLYAKACDQFAKVALLKQAIASQGLAGQGPAADLGGAEDVQPPQPANAPSGSSPSSDAGAQ